MTTPFVSDPGAVTSDPASLATRIREVERTSRILEPGAAARTAMREAVVAYGERFLEAVAHLKAYVAEKEAAALVRSLPIQDAPVPIGRILDVLGKAVDDTGINPASGGHVGYIPGGGIYASALGDYLADITNRYAGIRYANPGAVEMENHVLGWMASLVGYGPGWGGNLTSGGSVANLIAVVTARHAHGLKARDFDRVVVYLTTQAHHCVDKALRIAGLGECVRRYVAVDARWRMRPDALEDQIASDRRAGLVPWLLVASAGTTDVGAIDPLEALGAVARREGLWYHVDAAYGGFFALVDEARPRLRGMALSDSIVLDPHKGLFLPYGSGAVLVRDRRPMAAAHRYEAAYMQDSVAEESLQRDSPADLSPELTKHFRGPRLWLPLMLLGVAPFRACLEEKRLLTLYFHARVAELGFETGPDPELSVSTYRWRPRRGDAEAVNQTIVERIHADGRVYVTSTRLEGRFTLRMAALSFRTRLETIDLLLELLAESAHAAEGSLG